MLLLILLFPQRLSKSYVHELVEVLKELIHITRTLLGRLSYF